jgi:NAD(P)-dependent dehydrogenase (short-subunit alcohol dehydrogenase family)
MLLQDQVAVITGAASPRGIGKATARLLAAHGARVAILDLQHAAATEAARDVGDEHRGYACDVSKLAQCRAAVGAVLKDFGQIDILLNIAGITQPATTLEITEANFDAISDVNLKGTLFMCQAVIPHFQERHSGSIICMSSVSAQRGGGIFGGAHYSAAKAGILGLMKAMAGELGPDNIRVNAISPGLIQTDITRGSLPEARKQEIAGSIPLRRLGDPDEVARVCLFLASDLSSYISGATVDVNGGMYMR